jgi:antitoxin (DNA-binding transcriptional repressor) of toxin-antitoxin stability system
MNKAVQLAMGDIIPASIGHNHIPLADRADRIRSLVNVARGCIIEIGRELIEAKADQPHGQWLPWLEREFNWSVPTADRYMQVARAFQIPQYEDFASLTIDATALYALAAPDVPQQAREEAVERAESGEHITLKDAQEMVAKAVAARAETEMEIIANAVKEANAQQEAKTKAAIKEATQKLRDDKKALADTIAAIKAELASPDLKTIAAVLCKMLKIKRLTDRHYSGLAQVLGRGISVGNKTYSPLPEEELARISETLRLAGSAASALATLGGSAPPHALLATCMPVQRLMIRDRLGAARAWIEQCQSALEDYDPNEKV